MKFLNSLVAVFIAVFFTECKAPRPSDNATIALLNQFTQKPASGSLTWNHPSRYEDLWALIAQEAFKGDQVKPEDATAVAKRLIGKFSGVTQVSKDKNIINLLKPVIEKLRELNAGWNGGFTLKDTLNEKYRDNAVKQRVLKTLGVEQEKKLLQTLENSFGEHGNIVQDLITSTKTLVASYPNQILNLEEEQKLAKAIQESPRTEASQQLGAQKSMQVARMTSPGGKVSMSYAAEGPIKASAQKITSSGSAKSFGKAAMSYASVAPVKEPLDKIMPGQMSGIASKFRRDPRPVELPEEEGENSLTTAKVTRRPRASSAPTSGMLDLVTGQVRPRSTSQANDPMKDEQFKVNKSAKNAHLQNKNRF